MVSARFPVLCRLALAWQMLIDCRTQMCPPSSPFHQIPAIKMEQDMKVMYPYRADVPHAEKSFIYDNLKSMDWCENPMLTQTVSLSHRPDVEKGRGG